MVRASQSYLSEIVSKSKIDLPCLKSGISYKDEICWAGGGSQLDKAHAWLAREFWSF